MSDPKPPAPPSPDSAPPAKFDPNDPHRFRLTPEQWAQVCEQARRVIQLQGAAVNPITPTPPT